VPVHRPPPWDAEDAEDAEDAVDRAFMTAS
jgi:hypothetical protein